jgi:hypothetical protein
MVEIGGNGASSQARPLEADGDAEGELKAIAAAMRGAVELLAREWPQDYPEGAVEWLLVGDGGRRNLVCSGTPT